MKVVREAGKAGLQARPQPGATAKLAAEELALLPALLTRGVWILWRGLDLCAYSTGH
jgi:hypothetical protein